MNEAAMLEVVDLINRHLGRLISSVLLAHEEQKQKLLVAIARLQVINKAERAALKVRNVHRTAAVA